MRVRARQHAHASYTRARMPCAPFSAGLRSGCWPTNSLHWMLAPPGQRGESGLSEFKFYIPTHTVHAQLPNAPHAWRTCTCRGVCRTRFIIKLSISMWLTGVVWCSPLSNARNPTTRAYNACGKMGRTEMRHADGVHTGTFVHKYTHYPVAFSHTHTHTLTSTHTFT